MGDLLDRLIQKFRSVNHPVFGNVVVVPEDKFEPEWDEQLLDEGSEAHGQNGFIYVKIPRNYNSSSQAPEHEEKKVPEEKKVTLPIEKKAKKERWGGDRRSKGLSWSEEENGLLIKIAQDITLMMEDVRVEYERLRSRDWEPRSFRAIKNRLSALRREGRIPYVYNKKKVVKQITSVDEKGVCEHGIIEFVKKEGDINYLRCHDCKILFAYSMKEYNDLAKMIKATIY